MESITSGLPSWLSANNAPPLGYSIGWHFSVRQCPSDNATLYNYRLLSLIIAPILRLVSAKSGTDQPTAMYTALLHVERSEDKKNRAKRSGNTKMMFFFALFFGRADQSGRKTVQVPRTAGEESSPTRQAARPRSRGKSPLPRLCIDIDNEACGSVARHFAAWCCLSMDCEGNERVAMLVEVIAETRD